jgi:hypothetical protein
MNPGHVAQLSLDIPSGKWKATFQGQVLAESKNRQYIIDTIARGLNKTAKACGVSRVQELHSGNAGEILQANGFEVPPKPEFSITERFDFLANLTQMAIETTAVAVLVTGEGGLGKSYTVLEEVKKSGLTFTSEFEEPPAKKKEKKEASDSDSDSEGGEDDEEEEEEIRWINPGQVHIVKGFSSAKGLYRTLYEMNGKLIIFDDCDSIQKDANAINILKGALDSSDERWISWNAEEGRGALKLPRTFQFTGRVIFISNWSQHRIDGNLKSRCMRVDLSMAQSEKIERMKFIIHQPTFFPKIEMVVKEEALEFLEKNMDVASNLSLRSLLDTIKFRNSGKENWERQALYTLTA